MQKYLLLFLLTALTFSVNAQKTEKEPYLTQSLSNDKISDVEVQTSGGSISVKGVSASESRIEVYVYSNNGKNDLTKEEIKQRIEELYDLKITAANGKLVAIAKSKERIKDWKRALSFSFKVFVQRNVSTDLTTSGGSIDLENLYGNLDFATSGGSLNLKDVGGKIDGVTSGGSINVKNATDEIELTTSGGSINAKNCKGKLRLSTSGGSLDLNDLQGDIKATTSGGSIDGRNISGELVSYTSGGSIRLEDLSCSLETGTSGGNISVSMKELGKYVRISNSSGSVDLDLPKNKGIDLALSANRIKTDKLENFNGTIDDDEIEGKLNGGGVSVKVKAGSGTIRLALK